MSEGNSNLLTREELLRLLAEVGELLVAQRLEGQLYVVGGAAMALVFDARRITRDIDVAAPGDQAALWSAVAEVADRHFLPPDWVNTNATAFMTNEPDDAATELTLPGLRVTVASAQHLIAMKLRALRDRDLTDLDTLFRIVGVRTPEQAAAIHDQLFDESYIGSIDRDEALYAAQLVFDRARTAGRPIEAWPE